MNKYWICSQGDIRTWIGEVTFTHFLIFLLDRIFIQYKTNFFFAFTSDSSIENQIRCMTVVSVLHDIFVSAEVTYYLPTCYMYMLNSNSQLNPQQQHIMRAAMEQMKLRHQRQRREALVGVEAGKDSPADSAGTSGDSNSY
jgi:hypothetical protein